MSFEKVFLKSQSFTQNLIATNPFFVQAAKGTLKRECVAQFLENVRFLITHTVPHLTRAAEVAEERGMSDLAQDYREEIREETGHDKWARNDLTKIENRFGSISLSTVPASKKLVEFVRAELEEDPATLMAYAFFVENLTMWMGPKLISDVESKCGIPRDMMSVIGNHVKLDAHHVVEGRESIEAFLEKHPEKLPKFEKVVEKTMGLFDEFFEQVS